MTSYEFAEQMCLMGKDVRWRGWAPDEYLRRELIAGNPPEQMLSQDGTEELTRWRPEHHPNEVQSTQWELA